MKKLVIIPAYNESGNIDKTINDIKQNAPDFDYVIINDCSTDKTLEVLRKKGYNYLNLPINLGIGGAVQTGYRYAYYHGYDMAVQFDGDGQHNASYLDKMAEVLTETGSDMVIGSRFIEKEGFQSSGLRRAGIGFLTKLIKMMTKKVITDPTSGMRIVNRRLLEVFTNDYPKDYPEPESTVTALSKGYKITEIPVKMNEREEGASSISNLKGIYYMIKVSIAIIIARLNNRR
jgi:glycosyltransferase involved in cell wall biosynthesis